MSAPSSPGASASGAIRIAIMNRRQPPRVPLIGVPFRSLNLPAAGESRVARLVQRYTAGAQQPVPCGTLRLSSSRLRRAAGEAQDREAVRADAGIREVTRGSDAVHPLGRE